MSTTTTITTTIDTTPYWSTSATFPRFAKLAEDLVTDVVVVGAGVTGLSAAYLLARAGMFRNDMRMDVDFQHE